MLFDHHCHVLDHRPRGRGLKVLTLRPVPKHGEPEFVCEAGQFVMVDLPTDRFFFRRPFSVLSVLEGGVMEIYYKIVGQGTEMMAELRPGDEINVLGPLGKGFPPPANPDKALLIGGGIGIAPLYFMAKEFHQQLGKVEQSPTCFYGVRSQDEIGLQAELQEVFSPGRLWISTDDGSYGHHGNVCHLLEAQAERVREAEDAYICGPTPMMRAAVDLLERLNPALRVYVSLEEHMPCGTGACTGCVIPRADQLLPSKVCVEGPVFEARKIRWSFDEPFIQSDPSGGVGACSL